LHTYSSLNKFFPPIYSHVNAIGIILGAGNVGEALTDNRDEVNTYLSRDGGLNWIEIKQGAYIYEFGDHGGIIIMAKMYENIDEVFYSLNDGISWNSVQIASKV
jgi:hypothetical protein